MSIWALFDVQVQVRDLTVRVNALETRLSQLEGIRPTYPTYPSGCRVCDLGHDGSVMGYVCNRPDCPTRVSC